MNRYISIVILIFALIITLCNMKLEIENAKLKEEIMQMKEMEENK